LPNDFCKNNFLVGTHRTVLQKTVSREQLLSNSRAWRTTSRRTTSHQRLARTAKTNLESLLSEHLLLHLCVLACAHRRKGSLPRLCGERVLLRVIDTLRSIGFGLPSTNQAQGEYTRNISEHASQRLQIQTLELQVRTENPLQSTQFICAVVITHIGSTHLFREERR